MRLQLYHCKIQLPETNGEYQRTGSGLFDVRKGFGVIAVFGVEMMGCKRENMNAWIIYVACDQSVIFIRDACFMGRTEDLVYDFVYISN